MAEPRFLSVSARRVPGCLRTLGLALLLLASCRCAHGRERAPEAAPEAARESPPSPAPEAAWERGELPRSETHPDETPRSGGQVTVHLPAEPPSLNSHVHTFGWTNRLTLHHVYETLVGIDPYDHPRYRHRPELAERWEISDGGRVFTFFLRHGVHWHDGEPFTSRDVVATFDKLRDMNVMAQHRRAYLKDLEDYEALDDYTIRFTWKHPYFLALDTPFSMFPIMPAHVIEPLDGKAFNEAATNPLMRHPVGTGPFRFVLWDSNEKIVLARNESYWDRPAYLERVVFRIVKEAAVALQFAARGELDVVNGVLPEAWRDMSSESLGAIYHRSRYFDSNYAWIGWNQERVLFQDARVRRALTLLTDRPGIRKGLMHGLVRPTHCHFYWASPVCDFGMDPLPYDPEQAAVLLEEAGWVDHDGDGLRDKDEVPFRFTLMVAASADWAVRMGTKLKEDYARAGVRIDLQRVETSSFARRLRTHEFDATALLWMSVIPRTDPTQIWHSASIEGGSNFVSFRNAEADALIDRARSELDEAKRHELYREFSRILAREQPYTWLFVRPRLSLVHRRLRGVRESLAHWQYADFWVGEAP